MFSIGSVALGEGSCHVVRTLTQPYAMLGQLRPSVNSQYQIASHVNKSFWKWILQPSMSSHDYNLVKEPPS